VTLHRGGLLLAVLCCRCRSRVDFSEWPPRRRQYRTPVVRSTVFNPVARFRWQARVGPFAAAAACGTGWIDPSLTSITLAERCHADCLRRPRPLTGCMTLTDLATRPVPDADRALLPWLAALDRRAAADRPLSIGVGRTTNQQGANRQDHVHPRPECVAVDVVWGVMSLAALGTLVWRHPLADVAAKAAARSALPLRFSRW